MPAGVASPQPAAVATASSTGAPAVVTVADTATPVTTDLAKMVAAFDARVERITSPLRRRWLFGEADDPFAADGRTPRSISAAAALGGLLPSSIFLSRTETPIVIFDGRVYRTGDTIDGLVIVAIEERRVLLRDGERVLESTIPQPTFGNKR